MAGLKNITHCAALFVMWGAGAGAETGYTSVMTVDQGWDNADRSFFYFSPQGSPIVPMNIFKALEQPNSTEMFLDEKYLKSFGMIFWNENKSNPDGLPIGLTNDRARIGDEPYLGMNCSACHVTEIKVDGATALIDGGVSHFDFWSFMGALNDALTETFNDEEKFKRFAKRMATGSSITEDLDSIRSNLRQVMRNQEDWAYRNHASIIPGPGRVDALNVILNQVTAEMLQRPENARQPNAPVSYPFLWDAPYLDFVQYNGVVPNAGPGALARNVGQVLGVFGQVDLAAGTVPLAYNSSVNVSHLIALETKLETLKSPRWKDFAKVGILPEINSDLSSRGEEIYDTNCVSCHQKIERDDRGEVASIPVKTFSLEDIGTDPQAALGFSAREVVTGPLQGRKVGVVAGDSFCEVTHGNAVLAHIAAGVVLNNLSNDGHIVANAAESMIEGSIYSKFTHFGSNIRSALGLDDDIQSTPDYSRLIDSLKDKGMNEDQISKILSEMSDDKSALFDELVKDHFKYHGDDQTCMSTLETAQYRSRPLDGVWATGPFLHNGSVPTLVDLLKSPEERPTIFPVGNGEFDPIKVGFTPDIEGQYFMFDTKIDGNSNSGHTYGVDLSDDDKAALIEYIKGL